MRTINKNKENLTLILSSNNVFKHCKNEAENKKSPRLRPDIEGKEGLL